MKALLLGEYKYCMMPQGIDDYDSLTKYLNEHYDSFVEFKVWDDSNSAFPYFIKESLTSELINISTIQNVKIVEVYECPEKEYLEKLLEVAKVKCIECENFDGNLELDDNTRGRLSLDGDCYFFRKKEYCFVE